MLDFYFLVFYKKTLQRLQYLIYEKVWVYLRASFIHAKNEIFHCIGQGRELLVPAAVYTRNETYNNLP